MNFEQETRGDITILRPLVRLDSASSPALEAAVHEHLNAACNRLVFDLSRLDYISSAGLRVILMAGKRLRSTGGRLVLCGLGDDVRGVFEMSGFLNLFAVADRLDGALTLV